MKAIWQQEYIRQIERTTGRVVELKNKDGKYLVVDVEYPESAMFNTGIAYSEEQMLKMFANLKTRTTKGAEISAAKLDESSLLHAEYFGYSQEDEDATRRFA